MMRRENLMKRAMSIFLVCLILVGIVPVRAEAQTEEATISWQNLLDSISAAPTWKVGLSEELLHSKFSGAATADVGDNYYVEAESNNDWSDANQIYDDYTVDGSLSETDLIDVYLFELSEDSDIRLMTGATTESVMFGIADAYGELIAVSESYGSEMGVFLRGLEGGLPAGIYYVVVVDANKSAANYVLYYHLHEMAAVKTDPTCGAQGYTTYTCTVCGASYTEDYVDATGSHTYDSDEDAVCNVCGFVRDIAHEHVYASSIVTPPTCGSQGYTTHICTCGYSYEDSYTAATGVHTYSSDTDAICDVCGTVREVAGDSEEEFPFSEYEWEVLRLTNIQRVNNGLDPLTGFAKLQEAAHIRADELIEKFNHTRPDGTDCLTVLDEVGLTCWAAGENIASGQRSPAEVVNGTYGWMNSSGHRANILSTHFSHIGVGENTYQWVQLFTSGGSYTSISVMGLDTAVKVGTTIDDLGLAAVLNSTEYGKCYLPVAASYCTGYDPNTAGVQTVTISVLGVSSTFVIDVTDHDHVWQDATCLVPQTCTICGRTQGNVAEHIYETEVTGPTCTQNGYTTYTCTVCGDSKVEHDTNATGHSWQDATCTTPKTCAVCGETEGEALGHSFMDCVCERCGTIGGTCGENLTWTLVDGVLTISGMGQMDDYGFGEAPWYEFKDSIQSVEFGDGITHIGENAFRDCVGLTEMVVPDNITSIGHAAFYGCNNLVDVTLSENLTSIGSYAFCDCWNIKEIEIPHGVTTIESYVFYNCSALSSAILPEGVTAIGDRAFNGCTKLQSIVLPAEVTYVGIAAFENCHAFTEIYIPESVESIGVSAFGRCDNLLEISVSENNPYYTSIDGVLFDKIVDTLIQYPCWAAGEYIVPDSVTTIAKYAFAECDKLTKLTLQDGIRTIGNEAFGECKALIEIELPNSIENIGSGAFGYCTSLKALALPEGLTTIAPNMFSFCTDLETVNIPGTVISIEEGAFYFCSSLTSAVLPESVSSIAFEAFMGCENLVEVNLPSNVTEIADDTFSMCSNLEKITIPQGISTVGDAAFSDCSALKEIKFEGDAPAFIQNYYGSYENFFGVTATAYYPENNATWTEDVMQDYGGDIIWKAYCEEHTIVIDEAAAATCTSSGLTEGKHCSVCEMILVEQKVVPATGVHSYVDTVCEHCGIIGGTCGEDLIWTLVDGVLTISGTGEMDYFVPWEDYADQVTALVIEPGATTVSDNAFRRFKQLQEVTIADTVTTIGSCAFLSCTSLETVDIPASVKTIEDNAFAGCKKLSTVTLHEGLTTIGPVAFEGCEKLNKIEIPESVTAIGEMAFSNCKSLTTIQIPSGVTTIEAYTFQNSGLTDITIPDSVTTIKKLAFAWCNDLTSVTIPQGVTEIGETAFAYCGNLKEITFQGDAPAISEDAFATITADAYYPEGNDTWTSDVMQGYGGDITWCVEKKIETTPMYRLYNPNSGEHFYTGSMEERDMLVEAGWNYEGIAWNAPIYEGTPVYRVFNPNSGDHHYTMSQEEVDMLVGYGWKYEGVAWNSASSDHVPQQRLYNPNADCGSHHYTSSQEELDFLVSLGWIHEGIGWFGIA